MGSLFFKTFKKNAHNKWYSEFVIYYLLISYLIYYNI